MDNNTTVKDLTPRKSDQNKARASAEWAYGGNARNVFRDIMDAYKNPSAAKCRAWEACKSTCEAFGGTNLLITGKTCMTFSAVFTYIERATGALCYCYITRDYTRHCYA